MQCSCARSSCAVSAGEVYPCINAPIKAGHIREQSFGEIWKTSEVFQAIRGLTSKDFKTCYTCEDKPWCSRSPGTAFTNTGDYLGPDEYTCAQTKVRREVWEEQREHLMKPTRSS